MRYHPSLQLPALLSLALWGCGGTPSDPAEPLIWVGATDVAFVAFQGEDAPEPQSVQVLNRGGGSLRDLDVDVSYPPEAVGGWLTALAMPEGAPAELRLEASLQDLDVGTHTAEVTLTSPVALNSPVTVTVTLALGAVRMAAVSAGGQHTCSLAVTGQLFCWGRNDRGQVGDGTTRPRWSPEKVETSVAFTAVSAGAFHTCAIAEDRRAYCWGLNTEGQVGDGAYDDRIVPTPVRGLSEVSTLSSKGHHTCAVAVDGAAYCWGWNEHGQLGDGSRTHRSGAVPVATPMRFQTVSAALNHTCAIALDGGVQCWGHNGWGNLGTGAYTGRQSTPQAVTGGHRFAELFSGSGHTCGNTVEGRTLCWGLNANGQLGIEIDELEPTRHTPTSLPGDRSFANMGGGGRHTCGVGANGRALCWGWNFEGQLGDGETTQRVVPQPVNSSALFVQVSASTSHSCGATVRGTVYCWGGNLRGQLGDGTFVSRLTPVLVRFES